MRLSDECVHNNTHGKEWEIKEPSRTWSHLSFITFRRGITLWMQTQIPSCKTFSWNKATIMLWHSLYLLTQPPTFLRTLFLLFTRFWQLHVLKLGNYVPVTIFTRFNLNIVSGTGAELRVESLVRSLVTINLTLTSCVNMLNLLQSTSSTTGFTH